ncbi:MBL fold metallo-hydrolase [Arthrobacter sp. zg-Y820]|uniref:MBL fold metallo-hydrolase n=1 Tax=unclassified Arthrobacter TaxID=235627 RepID=UPI001E350328|nr:MULTISPECIES: MBL fold metallo-hydrolase [unclassified Arthrobacter]MCC9196059.1 MBL fold metallo-hydrolase [Arthrobacter sp. zg-Y820]MDK1278918.1 MBL fold metallo-hydrolase [Arthrobacter sp. zg.Y820]MDK1359467.1 MBL fold metallo-hydrolase [Arthrobacter sp. zg-Y1219]WIB08668.1 MBL fold metallo-hydrolase [Arthrobacter sp. zg-Y820]
MKLTKYTHSCVRLERDGNVLVLDPGTFSEVEEALTGAHAVLITHEHADHLDRDRVLAQLRANTSLVLYAPAALAAGLRAAAAGDSSGSGSDAEGPAGRILDVEPNSTFSVAGFEVQSFGGQHALIHSLVPVVANVGYLIDGTLYHPGDSFVVPNGLTVRTLLVPIHAPWSKVGEVIDFVIACGAERAYPIHDALLNENGLNVAEGHVTRFGELYGTVYRHLSAGESVEV